MGNDPASGGGGAKFSIHPETVTEIGHRFADHADELRPHAENLKNADLASAYGPWSEAAKPLEDRVKEIGIGQWADYCGSYGDGLHSSVGMYRGSDEDGARNISAAHGREA